jgi:nitric oxide reductase NorE protein
LRGLSNVVGQIEAAPRAATPARLPGDVNMWVFVLGDLVIFAVYFVVYMIYRTVHPGLFLASQRHLSVTAGAVNTLVLLASSRFVALGVQAARADEHRRATRLISYGAMCGLAFVVLKAIEWSVEISRGYTLPRNELWMFYYALTGVHLLHVLLGLGILAIAMRELRLSRLRRVWVVEAGATYWHMVDLLWVLIFALFYVMR